MGMDMYDRLMVARRALREVITSLKAERALVGDPYLQQHFTESIEAIEEAIVWLQKADFWELDV